MSYDKEPEPINHVNMTIDESYTGLKLESMEDLTAEWFLYKIEIN